MASDGRQYLPSSPSGETEEIPLKTTRFELQQIFGNSLSPSTSSEEFATLGKTSSHRNKAFTFGGPNS